jgi:hypothetical protein
MLFDTVRIATWRKEDMKEVRVLIRQKTYFLKINYLCCGIVSQFFS